jgi:hypothetical protein
MIHHSNKQKYQQMKFQEAKTFLFFSLIFVFLFLSLESEGDIHSEMFKCLSIVAGLLTYRSLTQNQKQLN